MDRNSIYGLLIIGAILIGWMVMSQPSEEEIARMEFQRDSIAKYEESLKAKQEAQAIRENEATATAEEVVDSANVNLDSIQSLEKVKQFGAFANASEGEDKITYLKSLS